MSTIKAKQLEGVHADQLLDNEYSAAVNPTISDDISLGFKQGSIWINTTISPKKSFICVSNALGAAIWNELATPAQLPDIETIEVNSIPIGMPFPQWFEGNSQAVVTKYPVRFIKLSKNLEGAYNSGKLGVSSAITTDETTFYIATITDVASPLNGQSVTLINSTENTTGGVSSQPAFLGAGETSQTRLANRLQGHLIGDLSYGTLQIVGAIDSTPVQTTALNSRITSIVNYPTIPLTAVTDGINGTPRVGKTTRPDTVTAVYYMRIK